MGVNQPDFKSAVIHICQQLDPSFNLNQIEERNSKANNYLGLTVTIQATSRAQLDEILAQHAHFSSILERQARAVPPDETRSFHSPISD